MTDRPLRVEPVDMLFFQPKREYEFVPRPAGDVNSWQESIGRSKPTSSRCGSRSESTNCF